MRSSSGEMPPLATNRCSGPNSLARLDTPRAGRSGWNKNGETSGGKVSTFEGAVQRTACPVCGKTPGVQSVIYIDADVPVKVACEIS
jgi:hypothetical protein